MCGSSDLLDRAMLYLEKRNQCHWEVYGPCWNYSAVPGNKLDIHGCQQTQSGSIYSLHLLFLVQWLYVAGAGVNIQANVWLIPLFEMHSTLIVADSVTVRGPSISDSD